MAIYFGKASTAISPFLIGHVERLYYMARDEIAQKDAPQNEEGPHRSSLAIPAYILAVAAVEAFVNEMFLSQLALMTIGSWPGGAGDSTRSGMTKSLERLSLPKKLIRVPQLYFGRSLDRRELAYQDMLLLTDLRHELVHYKMGVEPPKAVKILAERGIAFRVPPEWEEGGPHPWADRVSTVEGIRWAYNTACSIAIALLELIPEEKRGGLDALRHNFREIPGSRDREGVRDGENL